MTSLQNFRPLRHLLTAGALLTSLAAVAQSARPAHPPSRVERRADGTPELVRSERATAPAAPRPPPPCAPFSA
ncbi:MAG: hypothetical protein H7330_17320 [Hymenobacteraceae bacterium]|nr:hypothetical protein [Hymenobacteraceae bacterium]